MTPAQVRQRGNPGKRSQKAKTLPTTPDPADTSPPTAPDYLDSDARAIFQRLAAIMVSERRWHASYRDVLGLFAEQVATGRRLGAAIRSAGPNLADSVALLRAQRQADAHAARLADALGLTPRTRHRAHVEPAPVDGADELAALRRKARELLDT